MPQTLVCADAISRTQRVHRERYLRSPCGYMAYLLGQRPSDVVGLALTQLRGGVVNIQQHKAGAKVRVEIVGELATVLKRITKRKASYKICTTRLIVNQYGRPIGGTRCRCASRKPDRQG